MTGFVVSEPLRHRLLTETRLEIPHEACGFVSETSEGGWATWACDNAAPDPTAGFLIDAETQLGVLEQIVKRGEKLVAVYHSHPKGTCQPSEADRAFAEGWPGITWIIVGGTADDAELYVGPLP